eukprot:1159429-Pelagomonas_calceolata.AAC.7
MIMLAVRSQRSTWNRPCTYYSTIGMGSSYCRKNEDGGSAQPARHLKHALHTVRSCFLALLAMKKMRFSKPDEACMI